MTQQLVDILSEGCFENLKAYCVVRYIYVVYKQYYYEGHPVVSDTEFDSYEAMLKSHLPEDDPVFVVGELVPTCTCCKIPVSTNSYRLEVGGLLVAEVPKNRLKKVIGQYHMVGIDPEVYKLR